MARRMDDGGDENDAVGAKQPHLSINMTSIINARLWIELALICVGACFAPTADDVTAIAAPMPTMICGAGEHGGSRNAT